MVPAPSPLNGIGGHPSPLPYSRARSDALRHPWPFPPPARGLHSPAAAGLPQRPGGTKRFAASVRQPHVKPVGTWPAAIVSRLICNLPLSLPCQQPVNGSKRAPRLREMGRDSHQPLLACLFERGQSPQCRSRTRAWQAPCWELLSPVPYLAC